MRLLAGLRRDILLVNPSRVNNVIRTREPRGACDTTCENGDVVVGRLTESAENILDRCAVKGLVSPDKRRLGVDHEDNAGTLAILSRLCRRKLLSLQLAHAEHVFSETRDVPRGVRAGARNVERIPARSSNSNDVSGSGSWLSSKQLDVEESLIAKVNETPQFRDGGVESIGVKVLRIEVCVSDQTVLIAAGNLAAAINQQPRRPQNRIEIGGETVVPAVQLCL